MSVPAGSDTFRAPDAEDSRKSSFAFQEDFAERRSHFYRLRGQTLAGVGSGSNLDDQLASLPCTPKMSSPFGNIATSAWSGHM